MKKQLRRFTSPSDTFRQFNNLKKGSLHAAGSLSYFPFGIINSFSPKEHGE